MKLLIIVLNKTECLERLLTSFGKNQIPGATIIDSKGMAQELNQFDDLEFRLSLRMLITPAHDENKTIFMVVPNVMVEKVSRIVNEVTGGLDKPDTGILFTVPIDHIEGLREEELCSIH